MKCKFCGEELAQEDIDAGLCPECGTFIVSDQELETIKNALGAGYISSPVSPLPRESGPVLTSLPQMQSAAPSAPATSDAELAKLMGARFAEGVKVTPYTGSIPAPQRPAAPSGAAGASYAGGDVLLLTVEQPAGLTVERYLGAVRAAAAVIPQPPCGAEEYDAAFARASAAAEEKLKQAARKLGGSAVVAVTTELAQGGALGGMAAGNVLLLTGTAVKLK